MNVTINIPSITINLLSAEAQAGLAAIPALAAATSLINERIITMAETQAEAVARLTAMQTKFDDQGVKLDKISAETTAQVVLVRDLKQQIADLQTNASPEMSAALDKLAATADALGGKADAIDAQVDDAAPNPTPTPAPEPTPGNGGGVGPDGNPLP